MEITQSTTVYPEKNPVDASLLNNIIKKNNDEILIAIALASTVNVGSLISPNTALTSISVSQANKLLEDDFFDIRIAEAAKFLYNDYAEDKELTIFTSLDSEDFYEER